MLIENQNINKRYLIIDCNHLCHQAKYTVGDLSYEGAVTGTVYGFLLKVLHLRRNYLPDNIIFCWDSKNNIRYKIYPEYKQKRNDKKKEKPKVEKEFDNAFYYQMKRLRLKYLPVMGFKNIFYQTGRESDDIIASVCKGLHGEGIIVTNDADLYQCIRKNISVLNAKGLLTLQKFKKQHNIHPKKYGLVKAIAGCTTDGVVGVEKVGEKTAIKYLNNELKTNTKAYENIINSKQIIKRNKKLVILPVKGTHKFKIRKDKFSKEGFNKVKKHLGIKHLEV